MFLLLGTCSENCAWATSFPNQVSYSEFLLAPICSNEQIGTVFTFAFINH